MMMLDTKRQGRDGRRDLGRITLPAHDGQAHAEFVEAQHREQCDKRDRKGAEGVRPEQPGEQDADGERADSRPGIAEEAPAQSPRRLADQACPCSQRKLHRARPPVRLRSGGVQVRSATSRHSRRTAAGRIPENRHGTSASESLGREAHTTRTHSSRVPSPLRLV